MPHDDQMRETLHELDPYCAVGLARLSLREAVLTRKVPESHPDHQSDGIENHTCSAESTKDRSWVWRSRSSASG